MLRGAPLLKSIYRGLMSLRACGIEELPGGAGISAFLALEPEALPIQRARTLQELRAAWGECTRCGLAQGRTNIVYGEGPSPACLFILGEAPGREEDLSGAPFSGPSGELLDRMLAAIGVSRKDAFITSTVKCRPPRNRRPKKEELKACRPLLDAQLRIVSPKVILALGETAARALLGERPLKEAAGRIWELGRMKVVATYHPAYILRFGGGAQRSLKRTVWRHLQLLQSVLRDSRAPQEALLRDRPLS